MVFGATTRLAAICLFDRPRTARRRTSISLAVRPATFAPARDAMTGGGEDRGHGFWIEATGAGVAAQFCGGLAGGPGGPVWPWLEHGLVTVGGCQDAGRRWDGVAGQSGRVAGAVKTLALLAGQGRYWCQRRRIGAACAPRAAGRGGRVPTRRR